MRGLLPVCLRALLDVRRVDDARARHQGLRRDELHRSKQGPGTVVSGGVRSVRIRLRANQPCPRSAAERGQGIRRQLPKLFAPLRRWIAASLRQREQGREAGHPGLPSRTPHGHVVRGDRGLGAEARCPVGAGKPTAFARARAIRRDHCRAARCARLGDGRRLDGAPHRGSDEGGDLYRAIRITRVDALPGGGPRVRGDVGPAPWRCVVRPHSLARPARRGSGWRANGGGVRGESREEERGEAWHD